MAAAVVSKAEFARLCKVTPTRVGQWIREGKLSGEALEGEGRSAKICVDVARRQLGDRRDPGQAMGNGLETRLEPGPLGGKLKRQKRLGPDTDEAPELGDPINVELRRARLQQLLYANAKLAEEALARRGVYVRADETAAAMTRVAAKMLTVFEAGLSELAGDIAAEFGLDRHALLLKVKTGWRGIRAKAAATAQREAAELAPLIEDLDGEEDDAGGERRSPRRPAPARAASRQAPA